MKKTEIIVTIIALILVIALIGGVCFGYYEKITEKIKNPIVTMEVEGYGTIKLELYPEMAPTTVANFVLLAQNGFYNGTTFHRVVKDFMIQGGGYTLKETKNEETGETSLEPTLKEPTYKDLGENGTDNYTIKGEMQANGYKNNILKHEEGVISMARVDYTSYSSALTEESYNSASSQFFIMTKKNTSLDGYYTAFGKVIEGLDIVHSIENAEVEKAEKEGEEESTPVNDIIITSVTVDTQGIKYNKPETVEPFNYAAWVLKQYGYYQ